MDWFWAQPFAVHATVVALTVLVNWILTALFIRWHRSYLERPAPSTPTTTGAFSKRMQRNLRWEWRWRWRTASVSLFMLAMCTLTVVASSVLVAAGTRAGYWNLTGQTEAAIALLGFSLGVVPYIVLGVVHVIRAGMARP